MCSHTVLFRYGWASKDRGGGGSPVRYNRVPSPADTHTKAQRNSVKQMNVTSSRYLPNILFGCSVVLYMLLILPTISEHGVSFDERVDLSIAETYATEHFGWLRGVDLDSINVRLPMYVSGIVFKLSDGNPLFWSRAISSLLGVVTLIAVYLFCAKQFNRAVGVGACFILATSPYYLAFSKVAMTESDIYITCTTAWLLLFVVALRETASVKWVAATGICLGLALASKASASALVLATIVTLLLPNTKGQRDEMSDAVTTSRLFHYVILITATLVVIAAGWLYMGRGTIEEIPLAYGQLSNRRVLAHYLAALLPWLTVLWIAYRDRNQSMNKWMQVAVVPGIAVTTFLLIPPVHTTNPAIFAALVQQVIDSNSSFSWTFAGEAFVFHALVVFFKPSIIVGALVWITFISASWQSRYRPELRIPLLFFVSYFSFLVLKMTWAQTYYMMTMFPIIALLMADQLYVLWNRYRVTALVTVTGAAVSVVVDIVLTHPDYHLNGYQWLGARYLAGRSTIGYRGIVHTPSDGLKQMLCWSVENIPVSERVVYYIEDEHILRPFMKEYPILMKNGFNPSTTIDEANYVLVHINSTLDEGRKNDNPSGSVFKYNYDIDKLHQDFRKVFSLKRAFGIEVAAIWYRQRPYNVDLQANIDGYLSVETGLTLHATVE